MKTYQMTNSVADPTNASYIGWHQITQVGASLSVEIMQDQNRRIAQQVILAPELNRDLEGRLRAIKKLATNAQLPVESPSERMRKYDLTSIDAFQKTFQDLMIFFNVRDDDMLPPFLHELREYINNHASFSSMFVA